MAKSKLITDLNLNQNFISDLGINHILDECGSKGSKVERLSFRNNLLNNKSDWLELLLPISHIKELDFSTEVLHT